VTSRCGEFLLAQRNLVHHNHDVANIDADAFAELRRIKVDYVDRTLRWNATRSAWPRVIFRISGVLIIVTSLALPFLAAQSPDNEIAKASAPIASLVMPLLRA